MTDLALLLCDLQNDFLHPAGAMREAGGWVVSTHFTLVPGRNNEPFIAPHLRALRPFLARGDFAPGAWGHALVDALGPADIAVEKVAFSAFYMSRLEWVLARVGIRRLLVAGIVTNGGVASTVRDAQVREFAVTVLEDGCAAFDPATHATAVAALRPVAKISTVAQALAALRNGGMP